MAVYPGGGMSREESIGTMEVRQELSAYSASPFVPSLWLDQIHPQESNIAHFKLTLQTPSPVLEVTISRLPTQSLELVDSVEVNRRI
jgi:hypothetical protein